VNCPNRSDGQPGIPGHRFDLDLQLGQDQGADLDQGAGRAGRAEELFADHVDGRAVADVGQENPSAPRPCSG
jgi:hypothetical protein